MHPFGFYKEPLWFRRMTDTIVAIATPPGRGSIGIVRASGCAALSYARSLCAPSLPHPLPPRLAIYTEFHNRKGELLDKGLLLFFPAPHSFTGEDVVELHVHGSPFVLQSLVRRFIEEGARQAEPGEFSRRAFMNDKMDLVQAEAIADLINSDTEMAARAALQSLQGDFSTQLHSLGKRLIDLRVYVEAALDFPQEEIDFLADEQLDKECKSLLAFFEELIQDAHQGSLINELREVVILGEPNVGKSSLLNALCRNERAIVSQQAGTTRDLVKDIISLEGVLLGFTDTAGIRADAGSIEEEGIKRAWQSADRSDLILLVYDARNQPNKSILHRLINKGLAGRTLLVANKIDLSGHKAEKKEKENFPTVRISVKEGAGMGLLVEQLMEACGKSSQPPKFSARSHQLEKLSQARDCLKNGYEVLLQQGSGELFAEDLKRARALLDEIVGAVSSDELLDKIFAGFCIGK